MTQEQKDRIFSLTDEVGYICNLLHDLINLLAILDEDVEKDNLLAEEARAIYCVQRSPARMAILRTVERELQERYSDLTEVHDTLYGLTGK